MGSCPINKKGVGMDVKIAQVVRPSLLVYFSIIVVVAMFIDGNFFGINIKTVYIHLIETLLTTMVVTYFAGRSLEKVTKTYKGSGQESTTIKTGDQK
jgi:uncharacterized protein YqhQ